MDPVKARDAEMTPSGSPLAGISVIGLEQSVAGPLCTRILADLGATVTKIERPGGDFSRSWDTHAAGESAQFWWLNRRKRSISLSLATDEGRARLADLLTDADVLVHNMSPRAATRLGLDATSVEQRYPRLVACQISGYGAATSQRDRKAYDMLLQAESGLMSLTGPPDTPARIGVAIADVATGIYAATLVLAALHHRRTTGHGHTIDLAMLDVLAEFAAPMLLSHLNADITYPRSLDHHHAIAPYGAFPTADGTRLLIACHQDAEWARLCDGLLHQPDLATDARYATNMQRLAHRDQVDALVTTATSTLTTETLTTLLDHLDIAWAQVNDIAGLATHPTLAERHALQDVQAASGATVTTLVGLAEREFPPDASGRIRPPLVGEDGA